MAAAHLIRGPPLDAESSRARALQSAPNQSKTAGIRFMYAADDQIKALSFNDRHIQRVDTNNVDRKGGNADDTVYSTISQIHFYNIVVNCVFIFRVSDYRFLGAVWLPMSQGSRSEWTFCGMQYKFMWQSHVIHSEFPSITAN